MSTRAAIRHAVHARRRATGFTLVELMVAMILGLIVIAGVTSVFLAGQQSFRTNDALADVEDSSRIAFDLMARDIREAGLTGCDSISTFYNDTTASETSPPTWYVDWADNRLHGYPTAIADPALAGASRPTAVADAPGAPGNTDSLELMSAAGPAVAILSNDTGASTFTLNAATTDLANGDLAMVCSPSYAALLQIGYAAGGTTVSYEVPGNQTTDLGYPQDGYVEDTPTPPVPQTPYPFPPNSLISQVSAVDWFIGNNAVGGTSLYRVALANNDGALQTTTQEMVRGVTGMAITYLDPALSGALGTTYQTADVIDANGGWSDVTAVQVTLTIASTFQRASVTGTAPISRTYSFTTALRNQLN